ncbi:MAG TPA: dicarboxylate/amino acid:cation symporter [Longimicrobiales bacterium]
MSLTVRVLIGLVAGLAAGILISLSGSPTLAAAIPFIEPVGTIWVNALRMTVIPLVVASIVVGVASAADPRVIARIGGRAVAFFFLVLGAAAVVTVLIAPPLLGRLPFDPEGAAALRESAGAVAGRAEELPGFLDWVVGLVPANPIAAGADGALLPLIVFSVALGVAATRLSAERRERIIGLAEAVADAMLVLVRWVLELAPIGVFALALPLATGLGLGAAGAVAAYVLVVCGICALLIAAFYPAAAVAGGTTVRRFARAAGPAQAVALSSRSSLASLPAMMEGAEDELGLPPEICGFFLTLSASVFRVGTVVAQIGGVLFIAHLYGIPLVPSQYAAVALASVLTSFSVPAVPGGTILVMVPVLLSAGLPVEAVGILLAVDTIPDMVRTASNVTGHMAIAAVLGRRLAPAAAPAETEAAGA